MNVQDLTGQQFGRLTVIVRKNQVDRHGRKRIMWLCTCSCGKNTNVPTSSLKNGSTRSCGCLFRERAITDLTGRQFERLTVIRLGSRTPSGKLRWVCLCSCGKETLVDSYSLTREKTKSCGCLARENSSKSRMKHGHTSKDIVTSTYQAWGSMKARCTNRKNLRWQDYGGRGIVVCDRWIHSFESFLEDMGEKPEGLTLDRIDVNGNYEKSNCRWATRKEQRANQRPAMPKMNEEALTHLDRVRAMAERKRLGFLRSSTRDQSNPTYGLHWIYDMNGTIVTPPKGLDISAVEVWLRQYKPELTNMADSTRARPRLQVVNE